MALQAGLRTLWRFRQAWIRTMRQWSVCSGRLSSRAVRLLNRQWRLRFSQDAGDGFDGGSSLDCRRAGDVGDQGLPVFRWNLEMRVGVNERGLFFIAATPLNMTNCTA